MHDGVDTADALRFFIDRVTVWHHGFFVGNGDVDALPVAVLKESRDVFRLYFKKMVVVVGDLRVNLRGKTVAKGAAEETETHSSISTFL